MPLVVPGITSSLTKDEDKENKNEGQENKVVAQAEGGGKKESDEGEYPQGTDKTAHWTQKLVGKTVSDEPSNEINFCKRDLPAKNRVIQPGQMVTMDYNPDRLNVHVNPEGQVTHVTHG